VAGALQGLERELAELREGHAMRNSMQNSTAASPGPRVSSSLNWLLGGGGGGGGSSSGGGAGSPPPAPSSASSAAGDEVGVAVGGKSLASHRALDDLSKRCPPLLPTLPPTRPLPYQRVRGRESLYTHPSPAGHVPNPP